LGEPRLSLAIGAAARHIEASPRVLVDGSSHTDPEETKMEQKKMEPRMKSPVFTLPGVLDALQALSKEAGDTGLPQSTVELVGLRASQINGCTDERLLTLAAWRESPYFDDAERAALALTEAGTRLADRVDPVPDELVAEAARHFDERALAALVVAIAAINTWNRLNIITGQVAGEWTAQWVG
jgi:alkylhydroperoxidase family enzyme